MIPDPTRVPLASRIWVGDGLFGASVCPDGTVDWFAAGGLEEPPDCYALLDPAGGALRVGPAGLRTTRRRSPASTPGGGDVPPAASYLPGTMIAESVLAGPTGRLRVLDLFPWPGPNERPPGRLLRVVTALAGPIEVEVELRAGRRFRPAAQVSPFGEGLVWDGLALRTGFPLAPVADPIAGPESVAWRGTRRLASGEGFVLSVDRLDDERHTPLSFDAAQRAVEVTRAAWRSWVLPLVVSGGYRDAAERAALLLRSVSGSGAPLAGATTSLPRRAGGERTADRRYVRWADAAAAALTWARAGLPEDATAAEAWLREVVSGADLPWPAATLGDGAPVPGEEELASLGGWQHSQPVRTGLAEGRLDLDVTGDVLAAVSASTARALVDPDDEDPWRARPSALGPLSAVRPQLAAAADWLADHWDDADHGTWPLGGRPRRLVASRVQAWYALERAARLARAANPLDLDAAGWSAEARRIVRWLEHDGSAGGGGLRLGPSPEDYADAALLRVAWRSPWPAEHPIVTRTVDRTLERLASEGLVQRYSPELDDGVAGADSPDVLASLWAVRALAALGRWEEAHERLERIVALAGPSGLLTEAADPLSGELLGNLPAAGVNLALIDAALLVERGPR